MPMADPEATAQALKLLQSPGGQAVIVICLLGIVVSLAYLGFLRHRRRA